MQSDSQEKISPKTGEQGAGSSVGRRVLSLREAQRWKIVAILLVIVAVFVYLLLAPTKKPAADEEESVVVSVKVATAEKGSIAAEVTALGTIFPRKEATVSSKISGQIKQM